MLRRDEKWKRDLSKLKVTSASQTPRTAPLWSLNVSDITASCFQLLEKTEMQ